MANTAIGQAVTRRRILFTLFFGAPIIVGVTSNLVSERYALTFAAAYTVFMVLFMLWVYFFTYCPKCKNMFFGSNFHNGKLGVHKYFLNKTCNNCGYGGSG